MARDPVTKPAPIRPPESTMFFDRLMSLTVRHDFYDGDPFPDFVIAPTAPTQSLLHNLGMVVRPRRAGIDIIYRTGRSAALLRYLFKHQRSPQDRQLPPKHRHAVSPLDRSARFDRDSTHHGCWSRLTFTLSLKNSLFTNFTALPSTTAADKKRRIEMSPDEHALYLSNRSSEPDKHGATTPWIADQSGRVVKLPRVTTSHAHLHFPVPQGAARFVLYDTSGRAILRADPKYAPPRIPTDKPAEIPARAYLPASKDVTTNMNVSMANEVPGLFSYEIKDRHRKVLASEEFFYAGMRQAPLLFVDLFLASPDQAADAPAAKTGCYPIVLQGLPDTIIHESASAAADAEAHAALNTAARQFITPRDYEIRFRARETIWTYYIVLPPGAASSGNLAIRSEPEGALKFKRPEHVTLPTGALASCFTAVEPRPLRHRSDVSLRLQSGAREGGSARTLLDRLPTPSADRIGPPPSGDGTAASEIFVYL